LKVFRLKTSDGWSSAHQVLTSGKVISSSSAEKNKALLQIVFVVVFQWIGQYLHGNPASAAIYSSSFAGATHRHLWRRGGCDLLWHSNLGRSQWQIQK